MARSYERSPLNRGSFPRSNGTPTEEPYPGKVFLGYGYVQPENEDYGAELESVLAESLERFYPWTVGFFFGNTGISLELWNIISGISGFDD